MPISKGAEQGQFRIFKQRQIDIFNGKRRKDTLNKLAVGVPVALVIIGCIYGLLKTF